MQDVDFEIHDLVPDANVRARYGADQTRFEQSGCPASLWISIFNYPFDGLRAATLARSALDWLRSRELALPGTLIAIAFVDAWDGGVFSAMNTLETVRFTIAADGELSVIRSEHSPGVEDALRRLRYALSGRDVPE